MGACVWGSVGVGVFRRGCGCGWSMYGCGRDFLFFGNFEIFRNESC